MSQRSTWVIICERPPPSNTSLNVEGSSLSSHTLCELVAVSTRYLMQNPSASSIAYLFAILHLGFVLFPTYPFKVFRYLSIGNIHRVWTRPHNSSSSIKWINKCVMTSKIGGRNSCSNKANVIATSFFKSPIIVRSTTLAHNLLKTQHKQIITILHSLVIRCHMHKGKISCIIMW